MRKGPPINIVKTPKSSHGQNINRNAETSRSKRKISLDRSLSGVVHKDSVRKKRDNFSILQFHTLKPTQTMKFIQSPKSSIRERYGKGPLGFETNEEAQDEFEEVEEEIEEEIEESMEEEESREIRE